MRQADRAPAGEHAEGRLENVLYHARHDPLGRRRRGRADPRRSRRCSTTSYDPAEHRRRRSDPRIPHKILPLGGAGVMRPARNRRERRRTVTAARVDVPVPVRPVRDPVYLQLLGEEVPDLRTGLPVRQLPDAGPRSAICPRAVQVGQDRGLVSLLSLLLAYPYAYFIVHKVKSPGIRVILYMAVVMPCGCPTCCAPTPGRRSSARRAS